MGGGWPNYEFGDGASGGFSGILRRENGEPSIRLWSRSTTDCPNRFSVEFQDSFNEYQQDSLSLLDAEDISVSGQEMTGPIGLLGIPNYDQAARILKFNLDRTIKGNTYVEFETSVKALGLRPGDIITLTYLKDGFEREPFRIVKIAPTLNYQTALITAQLHRDEWYDDTNVSGLGNGGGGRHPSNVPGIPLPLIGPRTDDEGDLQFDISEKAHYQGDGGASTELTVGFVTPGPLSPTRPNIPLVSLFPRIDSESGTLGAAQTVYYAVTAVNSANQESRLSFVVRAVTSATSDTNSIALTGLSFPADAVAYHVYRGANPAQLYRIATSNPIASEFIDNGLALQPIAPPDPNYDHANFYWRMERQPEYAATIHTPSSIGNDDLQMTINEYRGMLVRLTHGKGAGQERSVVSNSNSELILNPPWNVEPDATSTFVVTESAWRFGAMGKTSPVQFAVPNQPGRTVQISGRAANVSDRECAAELSLITRWQIGGADRADEDAGPPPMPVFGIGMSPSHPGTLELSGVGFGGTANTRQIVAGTLSLDYWDELAGPPEFQLSCGIDEAATVIDLFPLGQAQPGSLVQVDDEILRVKSVLNGGGRYEVTRGVYGSPTSVHQAQSAVFHLQQKVAIVPFVRGFFGSPASGSWSFPVALPNARVAGATFFVTNSKGESPTAEIGLTQTTDYGLRTLAGGQFSFQVDGFLAIQNGITPDLFVDSPRSVRDISAIVRRPATGAPIQLRLNQNGEKYCELKILQDEMISHTVDGFSLPPLKAGACLSLDVISVGQSNPGSDLTLTIRL